MRKVIVRRAGGYERLELETVPDPRPGPGEVLVRTEAMGVNFADCVVRMGLYESAKKYVGWPITPGFEVAGTVEAVGEGVTDARRGARVLAVTRFSGYATHVVVPRHQVFAIPEGFSAEEAATFPAVYLTAYYALLELARPRPGAKVLVHSAAGGVGSALLQLGRDAGLFMVGVVGGSHKVQAAQDAGASAVIDKSTQDLWAEARRLAPDGYDVVLDANGVETLGESYRHLAQTGRLVIYGFHSMLKKGGRGRPSYAKLAFDFLRTPRFNPLFLTNDNKGVLGFNLSYMFERREILEEAMDLLLTRAREGRVKALPVTTYALDRVADAHRDLESGRTIGKLALVP